MLTINMFALVNEAQWEALGSASKATTEKIPNI